MGKRFIIILSIFFTLPLAAQEIIPRGQFHKDSVKIGEALPYSLWVRYPKDLDIAFPDSLFDFSPFELDKRQYFTTRSDSLYSLDSAVYYFSTFEIDSVQYLTLPIFIINEFDSTVLYTNTDSIVLNQVVASIPDSVAVIVNTELQNVPLAFNYPYFIIGVIAALLLILIIYLIFGKSLQKAFKAFWLSRRHKKFLLAYEAMLHTEPIEVEHTLGKWKLYMEKLSGHPYVKLTSKEIVALANNEKLVDPLRTIDRYIYAGSTGDDILEALQLLKESAKDAYERKLKELKNG